MDLQILSVEDVCQIYGVLIADFAESSDPISPCGIRSADLLASAVSRQHTGFQGHFKYPGPIENAATLTYGICCDHPFINGNKRTALVAMLAHLDKNKFSLYDTSQDDLYELMIGVADHNLGVRIDKRAKSQLQARRDPDDEVSEIANWLRARAARVKRGERVITYRQLRQILSSFGYTLENPRHNSIEVVKYEDAKKGIFTRRIVQERTKIGSIGWPNEGTDVAIKSIKAVREMCSLREEDGVDSDSFYSYMTVIDYFVNHYRKVLTRLAKT